MKKLYYITTNARDLLAVSDDAAARYETYTIDGSDGFPVCKDTSAAFDWLCDIINYTDDFSGADMTYTAAEFAAMIAEHKAADEILAQLAYAEIYRVTQDKHIEARDRDGALDSLIEGNNHPDAAYYYADASAARAKYAELVENLDAPAKLTGKTAWYSGAMIEKWYGVADPEELSGDPSKDWKTLLEWETIDYTVAE